MFIDSRVQVRLRKVGKAYVPRAQESFWCTCGAHFDFHVLLGSIAFVPNKLVLRTDKRMGGQERIEGQHAEPRGNLSTIWNGNLVRNSGGNSKWNWS